MSNSFINDITGNGISARHTGLLLLIVIRGLLTAVRSRIVIQSVLLTQSVGNQAKLKPRFFIAPQSFAVNKGHGVDYIMTMQVLCVQVGCNNNLKSFAPHFICKFHSDFLCNLRGDVLFLKTQVSVVGLYAFFFAVSFLNGHKLVSCGSGIAVDTLDKEFSFGFFFVLCVSKHITKSLILFLGINVCRCLFGIGGIVDYLTEP